MSATPPQDKNEIYFCPGVPGLAGGTLFAQLNITINLPVHCSVVQAWHDPTIDVFQSVCFWSNWQDVPPPFEISAQGSGYPGNWATVQPFGIGTRQSAFTSPFTIPIVQFASVHDRESAASPLLIIPNKPFPVTRRTRIAHINRRLVFGCSMLALIVLKNEFMVTVSRQKDDSSRPYTIGKILKKDYLIPHPSNNLSKIYP